MKKLHAILKHATASYLRALAAAIAAIQVGDWVNWMDVSHIKQFAMSALGALIAPAIKAFTDGADWLDESANQDEQDHEGENP